ncbi:g1402 [Coccomyxa viridis]|uniref:G1402 protein n=1 Tax=Coccomyxa viridis TaxID=1274662 RepID=A0ABP1FHX9_9CHLO
MESKTTDITVVPSGQALSIAAKLLGVKSLDDVIASEGQQEVKEEFRPPLLGLGADPKKHGKAISAAMKVERRLAQHIRGRKSADMSESPSKRKLPGAASGKDSSESEADDDGEGRAGAILERPRQAQQGASTQKHMEQHLHSYDALCNTWNPSPQPCQDVLSDVALLRRSMK